MRLPWGSKEVREEDPAIIADEPLRIEPKWPYFRKISDRYVARECGQLRNKDWEGFLDECSVFGVRWKHHRVGYMLNPSKEATYVMPGEFVLIHEASGRTEAIPQDRFRLYYREDGSV